MQVSGGCDISYAKAAYKGAELLDIDSRLVQPVEARYSGAGKDLLPVHTTLNTERLKSMLRIEPPDVRWTIEKAFIQPQALDRSVGSEELNYGGEKGRKFYL